MMGRQTNGQERLFLIGSSFAMKSHPSGNQRLEEVRQVNTRA
jgi:hypothetical protein